MGRPTAPHIERSRLRVGPWLAFAAPLAAVALIVAFAGDGGGDPADVGDVAAPNFHLRDTAGGFVSLAEATAQGDALLYFSMGVGCDGCFLQIPEVAEVLEALGITLVPIMVDPAEHLAAEAARLGVDRPILVDADRSVSEAYGMLGQFGHGDVPSHSFALVTSDRNVAWVRHYAQMFVPVDQLLADLGA